MVSPRRLAAVSCAFILAVCLSTGSVSAVSLAIDMNTKYQEIDGFGGFGGMNPWWTGGPFYNDTWLNLVIDEMGLSIFRTEMYPEEQIGNWTKQEGWLKAIAAKAQSSNVSLKFMATIWTPPGRFKTSGTPMYGSLKSDQIGPYADYIVEYIRKFKTASGRDLYLLCPQNEPNLECQGFNCCNLDTLQYADLTVALAKKVKAAGLPTKLAMTDDIAGKWGDFGGKVARRVHKDADGRQIATVISEHYVGAYAMMGMYVQSNPGIKAWNTEFGNNPNTWDGAWANALAMKGMLTNNFSGIVYWLLGPHTNAGQMEEAVMPNNTWGPKARAIQAFARTIRPGARRVRITVPTADSKELLALAFVHPVERTATVLLMNDGTATKSVSVTGTGLPTSFDVHVTSSSQNWTASGTIAPGASFDVPAKSIVSFYSKAGTVKVTEGPAALRASLLSAKAVSRHVYGLDGRLVDGVRPAKASGVFCSVAQGNGRALAVEKQVKQ